MELELYVPPSYTIDTRALWHHVIFHAPGSGAHAVEQRRILGGDVSWLAELRYFTDTVGFGTLTLDALIACCIISNA